ncbi:MAG TPA: CBS domain-containing protein [Polyangiales bacterium]|nr:CBS domain-containing protein [Polyangiales bacterium]
MNAELALLATFSVEHPIDVANLLERGTPEEIAHVLGLLERDAAGRVVARMTPTAAAAGLALLEIDSAAEILAEAGASAAALVLARCPEQMRRTTLDAMTGREAAAIRGLLVHAAHTAGSLMDALAFRVPDDATTAEALEQARGQVDHVLYYVYVVDRQQRLVGVTTLRQLLQADPAASVHSVMRERPVALLSHASLAAVVAHPGWRHYHALPVLDREGALLGVIRYDTAREVERELGQAVRRTNVSQTAGALAQLYAIGTLGMAEWFSALSSARRKPKSSA